MKLLRPVLLATLLVLTFYFVTTRLSGPDAPSWVTRPPHVELTEAAGPSNYDADEQNNINVYKKALPSVVNITSTAVAFDFFYGAVPQQGMGSGFVIDTEGHILTNNHVGEGARQLEVTTSDKKKYKAQIPDEEKARRADFVIDNSGSVEETRHQVQRIYAELKVLAKRLVFDR